MSDAYTSSNAMAAVQIFTAVVATLGTAIGALQFHMKCKNCEISLRPKEGGDTKIDNSIIVSSDVDDDGMTLNLPGTKGVSSVELKATPKDTKSEGFTSDAGSVASSSTETKIGAPLARVEIRRGRKRRANSLENIPVKRMKL